jgi:hypothetical protein
MPWVCGSLTWPSPSAFTGPSLGGSLGLSSNQDTSHWPQIHLNLTRSDPISKQGHILIF